MLKEYLQDTKPEQALWRDSMPGVQLCTFVLPDPGGRSLRTVPLRGSPFQFETFFCIDGRMTMERQHGAPCVVEPRSVLLLSEVSGLRACRISGSLRGVLVAAEAGRARGSFAMLCAALGVSLDTQMVKRHMAMQQGCAVLSGVPWTRAMFEHLCRLAPASQGGYCVFKAVELLYLLSVGGVLSEALPHPAQGGYLTHCAAAVKAYMEAHLFEKMTIAELSHRFSISPTSLKTMFRQLYGMPLHQWLMERRLERAAELLQSAELTVQQVAAMVGYDGVSQFSLAFRRQYGVPPGQFKKMSGTGGARWMDF